MFNEHLTKKQQEPKITAFVSSDYKLISTFKEGKDIYATLSSVAFNRPYEECLEFHPETHELQPEGKKLRGQGKILVLGINYGMSAHSIADMLFGDRDDMTDDEKLAEGQQIQDSLMKGFPDLQQAIARAQSMAREKGYTETITGRRRHHPDMQLPKFEFSPMKGYMNPDVDPLDPNTLKNQDKIPSRIVKALEKEFNNYKYYGQIVKRTKELADEKIKVTNNQRKIDAASREVFNAIIQGEQGTALIY